MRIGRRHRLIYRFALFALLSSCIVPTAIAQSTAAAATAAAAPTATSQPVRAVLRIGMTVRDMDRSIDFLTRALDFEKTRDIETAGNDAERLYGLAASRARIVRMQLGDETLELTQFLARAGSEAPPGRDIPNDSRSNDRWFQHAAIVTTDMDAAYQRLRAHQVRHVSPAPQRLPDWNKAAGGIRAFYFNDPDGHVLEVIQFPPGKGDPKWQARKELFAGIDHTAIVVSDTQQSLAFYRDRLGLKVAGRSENHGPEQSRLNNVEGAHLRITTLRAPAGPGVELLEYLAPRDGRPYPPDARANDLIHWTTTFALNPSDPGLADTAPRLTRDPDGHAVQFVPDESEIPILRSLDPAQIPGGAGKFLALHFLLETECPVCLKHTHDYTRRAAEVPDVIHVFLKPDSAAEVERWMKELPKSTRSSLPLVYRDPDSRWARQLKIPDGYAFHGRSMHYPALVVLDPKGNDVFRYVGKSNADRCPFDRFAARMAGLERPAASLAR